VHLLDQMLRILPDGVYLENLTQLNDGITLVGLAQSNARVSTLMRAIEDSAWLSSPSLVLIESTTVKNTRLNQFTLTFKLVKSKVDNKPDVGEVKKP
jgi:type IV pilus assembly protein PilN